MQDVEELKEKAAGLLNAVADHVEAAAEQAVPVAEKAAAKAHEVASELSTRGEEALAAVEKHATTQKQSHRGRKAFAWSLAALGAGGVAYLLWRRSRPVEDPWAEEYWVDLKDDSEAELAEEIALEEAIVEVIEEALAEAEAEAESEAKAEAKEEKSDDKGHGHFHHGHKG